MQDPSTPQAPPPDYGDSFADVYDRWYATITDPRATADRVALEAATATRTERADRPEAGSPRVLELGIGSGRLALPIAARGLEVVGIDSSPAMLERLTAKDGADAITVHLGDMADADQLVEGPFAVVLIAFNTLFNLVEADRQARCLTACARLLAPHGSLLIEATVPASGPTSAPIERGLSTARVELDRVVLAATEHDPATQLVTGQHIDITAAGIRLRPWRIRYLSPGQIDALAAGAGLDLVERHADWEGAPWTAESTQHVSRYRRL